MLSTVNINEKYKAVVAINTKVEKMGLAFGTESEMSIHLSKTSQLHTTQLPS